MERNDEKIIERLVSEMSREEKDMVFEKILEDCLSSNCENLAKVCICLDDIFEDTTKENYLYCALQEVVINGNLKTLNLLLEAGADVNAEDDFAIRKACEYGNIEMVKLLLEAGADVTAKNNEAIQSAARNGHTEIIKLLIKEGADVTADNNYAIQVATMNGYYEIVKLLIEAGADVTVVKKYAIQDMYYMYSKKAEIAKLLIKEVINVSEKELNALVELLF